LQILTEVGCAVENPPKLLFDKILKSPIMDLQSV